ncbi:MAG: carboxymuconolactone decarboxylase family protein [Candidatus Eisenbacteria sp.]|nr:carboxymuconolactone decarboxylase family protein [Candidatus Eisenbacteria bacterium]
MAALSLLPAIHFGIVGTSARASQSAGDNTYPEMAAKMAAHMEELGEKLPDVMTNFLAVGQAAFRPGALDIKSKELICLGIAVAIRCDACIAWHTRGSLEAGATEQEIVEALGVAITMGGGPSVAYATHALEAMEQFKAAQE